MKNLKLPCDKAWFHPHTLMFPSSCQLVILTKLLSFFTKELTSSNFSAYGTIWWFLRSFFTEALITSYLSAKDLTYNVFGLQIWDSGKRRSLTFCSLLHLCSFCKSHWKKAICIKWHQWYSLIMLSTVPRPAQCLADLVEVRFVWLQTCGFYFTSTKCFRMKFVWMWIVNNKN